VKEDIAGFHFKMNVAISICLLMYLLILDNSQKILFFPMQYNRHPQAVIQFAGALYRGQ
jgi:hypothetical protein